VTMTADPPANAMISSVILNSVKQPILIMPISIHSNREMKRLHRNTRNMSLKA
jgi:hypothetical protein